MSLRAIYIILILMKKKSKNTGKINFHEKGRWTTKAEVASLLGKQEVVGMRLNKYVAHCGICSRRQAAELVKDGKIKVNDEVVLEPFYQIKKGDKVEYKDEVIQPEDRIIYLLLNKPKNTITTLSDEKGRTTVMDIIGQEVAERIFPVGRLDRDTTGLLLLTNDGQLAQKLAHPSKKVQKIYQVFLDKPVSQKHLEQIAEGPELEDGKAVVNKVFYSNENDQQDVTIEIHMGKNRIVRRIFEHFGYKVKRLDRIYYGGLTKKDLPRGQFRFLSEREVIMLKHFS